MDFGDPQGGKHITSAAPASSALPGSALSPSSVSRGFHQPHLSVLCQEFRTKPFCETTIPSQTSLLYFCIYLTGGRGLFYIKAFFVLGGESQKCYVCVLSHEASQKVFQAVSVRPVAPSWLPPVPHVPSVNWHFLEERFFLGLFFSIKGKNRHQTCPGACLGCFTAGEGIPVHRILKAERVLAFPQCATTTILSPKPRPQVPHQAPAFHPASSAPTWAQGLVGDHFLQDLSSQILHSPPHDFQPRVS